ncbi:hypothetical protein SAY86_032111 [Trapa natans]|uniref:Uncharacterized protein n=1 Tax=Trapa natans TaxID=22666 RepID=A0AAN7LMW9_TRANT|nr:hypothetical protein SAY86_032111 [Trapa natans]
MHPPRASSTAKVNATLFFTCDLRPRRYPVIASFCINRRGDYQMRGIVIDMVHAKVCNFVIPNRVRVLELHPLQPALLLLVMEGFSEGRVPGLVHDGVSCVRAFPSCACGVLVQATALQLAWGQGFAVVALVQAQRQMVPSVVMVMALASLGPVLVVSVLVLELVVRELRWEGLAAVMVVESEEAELMETQQALI